MTIKNMYLGHQFSIWPIRRQHYKMVKHIQAIRRQFADVLLECVWPFCEAGAERIKNVADSFWNDLLAV